MVEREQIDTLGIKVVIKIQNEDQGIRTAWKQRENNVILDEKLCNKSANQGEVESKTNNKEDRKIIT